MGCIQSKADVVDTSPNIFSVINIDDEGREMWAGQIEITATELILHRKEREPTSWPLKSLRRYGFHSDMFSFESGRRCMTGEGIYAFKCKRAHLLFQTLQDCLQRRAFLPDDRNTFPVPANTNGPAIAPRLFRSSTNNNVTSGANTVGVLSVGSHVTNQTVLTVSISLSPLNSSDNASVPVTESYLEPNQQRTQSRFVTRGSIGSAGGPLSPDLASPGSPGSFTNILEVTPLPNPGLNNNIPHGISNLYQEFPVREFNNNKRVSLDTPPADPAPTPNFTAAERAYENTSPISLKHSMSGTSAFSGEPQVTAIQNTDDTHSYMNVALGETNNVTSPNGDESSVAMRTPTVQNAYGFKRTDSLVNDPSRSYENMEPLLRDMRNSRNSKPENIFSKVELPAMNYLELDLDNPPVNNNNTTDNGIDDTYSLHEIPGMGNAKMIEHRKILQYSNSFDSSVVISSVGMTASNSLGLLPPESPKKSSSGYATIDYDKTVALSNTVSNSIGSPTSDHDAPDGSRRTRHS